MKRVGGLLSVFLLFLFFVSVGISEPSYAGTYENPGTLTPKTGTVYNGTLRAGQKDWVKVTMPKGGVLNWTIQNESDTDSLKFFLRRAGVTDDYEYDINVSYSSDLGIGYKRMDVHLSKGTYYLEVRGDKYADQDTKYSIRVNKARLFENCSEPNNIISQATRLTLGKVYHGIFAFFYTKNDPDIYKVQTSSAGTYYMTFEVIGTNDIEDIGIYAMNYEGAAREAFVIPGKWSDYVTDYVDTNIHKKRTVKVKLPKGTTYLKLRGLYGHEYYFSLTKQPTKVQSLTAKRTGKKKIRIKWKKQSSVTGYQIYRKKGKSGRFVKIKTIKGAAKHSFVDKKAKKGKTRYYYKVRSYRTVHGVMIKGPFSKVKKAKR